MRRPGGIDDDRVADGFRKKLAGYRRQPAQAGSDSLRWSSHHGHHAGRAPGKAAVGLQRTVRRRPLARQHVAGRERCTAQHVFGLRPRGVGGGLLGGLCFVLPGFFILLALTMGYAALGVTPIMRGALYGLGPVVLGIYLVAVYRLGRAAVSTFSQALVAVAAAAAVIFSPIGIAATLLLAGGTGVLLFHSTKLGATVLAVLTAVLGLLYVSARSTPVPVVGAPLETPLAASLTEVSAFLLKVGTFTFGGGLTMIAFIQEQVVTQFHWLTPQEFIDGLALGQFTPGPILMVAAYVGYKVAGLAGAGAGAAAAFLPSFVMMLAVLPVLDHLRKLVWTKAAMRGIGPAVMGMLGVSLVRMAPHALPDVLAAVTLIATVTALLVWRVGTVKAMVLGSLLGVLRSRLSSLRAAKGVLYTFTRALGTAS